MIEGLGALEVPVIDADIHRCPNCGGDVPAGERRCGYCRSALSTVRCAHCLAMNDAVALHCWGCGRELGLEPVAEAGTLPCPRCGEHLSTLGDAHSGLYDCDACGGQFIEHEMLRAMLENRTPYTFAQKARTLRAALAEPVRYLPCPSCRSLMNRKNFGGESGVVVDVCARHGTFFDVGELPLVLAFVEAGGLERAQQRADEARRRAVREQATERSALMGELEADPGPSTLDLVGEFIHFLESLVVRRR